MNSKWVVSILLLALSPIALASDAGFALDHMEPDLDDKASLQRGAKTYMNYCLGCHELKYQRYKRTAEDLNIPLNLMLEHLVFDPDTRIGDLIENNLTIKNSKTFFGAVPPDLTLNSNLKGVQRPIRTRMSGRIDRVSFCA